MTDVAGNQDRTEPLPTLRDLLAKVHLRLIAFTIALATISLLASGVLMIRSYAQRNLELIAHNVSYVVEPAVILGDPDAIAEGVASVAAAMDVKQVQVVDGKGHILTRWVNPAVHATGVLEPVASRLLWSHPVIKPVRRGNSVLGEVRVYGDSGAIVSFFLSGTLVGLLCLGATIAATQLLARRLHRDVIAPLDHIAEVAHAITADRRFEKRIPASGIAEIDQIGRDFNGLIAEIQAWQAVMTIENAELTRQSTHDSLTGLGNRVLFERKLHETVTTAKRSNTIFAVLYLDIDEFKQINDRYGHESGDAVLIEVAGQLRRSIRKVDHPFRLGGDEFAVILAPFERREQVQTVIDRINHGMSGRFRLSDGPFATPSLSVGVAIYPEDGSTPSDLLRRADLAMYSQKRDRGGWPVERSS